MVEEENNYHGSEPGIPKEIKRNMIPLPEELGDVDIVGGNELRTAIRQIDANKDNYDVASFTPRGIEFGDNPESALILANAIQAHGDKNGWTPMDVLAAFDTVQALEHYSSAAVASTHIKAVLNGTTGNLGDILDKVVGIDAPKSIRNLGALFLAANKIINMGMVGKILIKERASENGLRKLVDKLQIMTMPDKMPAFLNILNNGHEVLIQKMPARKNRATPDSAITALAKISPFSLYDMSLVYDSMVYQKRAVMLPVVIENRNLRIEVEAANFRSHVVNLGKTAGVIASATTEGVLVFGGETAGGVLGGILLFLKHAGVRIADMLEKDQAALTPKTKTQNIDNSRRGVIPPTASSSGESSRGKVRIYDPKDE